ncbi:hypothetical protein DPMN_170488 [Dreissena polymorpha]|uniref:Uncharacterized protein n=1 Tax=Dreissena polymorpha TaxID=45954 RepID=A0A9D4DWE6_DREPO|nr:hypothetical protein DPMN_170488 [Dreissena polymorpha]
MFGVNSFRDQIAMYTSYSAKRPDRFSNDDDPFYLAPRIKEGCSSQLFLRQRLGEVKLAKMLNTMAVAANRPKVKRYTNHSA